MNYTGNEMAEMIISYIATYLIIISVNMNSVVRSFSLIIFTSYRSNNCYLYREYSKMCSIHYVYFANPSPVSKKWPSKDGKKSTTPLCNLESEMNQIENVK